MGLDGVAPVSPPIVPPQAVSEPPEDEPEVTVEEEGGPKANGVVRKLQSGHFKGKGVSDVRLRIAHFDNPQLERVDPDDLLPVPDDGPGKAYEKFLAQYRELYEASLVSTESEEPVAETPPATEGPVVEMPLAPEGPVVEIPLVPEGPVVETPPAPEEPVDEGDGALAAFKEILDTQFSQQEPETLDVVV